MTDAATPTLAEVIDAALTSRLLDVHTALPGTVQAYDSDAQTATIELGVKRVLENAAGEQTTEDLPVLENVKVTFPRAGDYFISFPVKPGDTGMVVFTEASMDQWRSNGGVTSPGDIRRHSLTGASFHPGLATNDDALEGPALSVDMAVGKVGGVQIRLKDGGTVEVTSGGASQASDFVAMAALVKAELDAIKTAYDTHMHPTAALGPPSPPAAPLPAPGDVSSTNLKADSS